MPDVMQDNAAKRRHFLQPANFSKASEVQRFQQVLTLVEGRSVLDLGAGSGHWRSDWMHGQIRKVASEVVGVEIDEATVDAVRSKGYDLVHADAENLDLGRTFDVVFAGELIEHLASFDGFLKTAKRHLAPGGVLVLTTPNAFAVSNFVYRVLPGAVRVNSGHTCWFCPDTARQLLSRYGFEAEVTFVRHETPGRWRRLAARLVRAPLPDRVAWNTLLVVARSAPP